MDDIPSSPGPRSPRRRGDRDDDLLRPAEAAALLGVAPPTVARWAREGLLAATETPGGHRRYRRGDILAARDGNTSGVQTQPPAEQTRMEADAVRLYRQGWSVRRVADTFEVSYGTMRRILIKHRVLRNRGGTRGGGWAGFS